MLEIKSRHLTWGGPKTEKNLTSHFGFANVWIYATIYTACCSFCKTKSVDNGLLLFNFFFQIEKCQDVTLGYSTEKQCDKWPKTVCELNKVTRKRYTPETKCDKTRREVCISNKILFLWPITKFV